MIKVAIAILFSLMMLQCKAESAVRGGIEKREVKNFNQVIDSQTGQGIPNAKVSVPKLKFITVTDEEGRFNLRADINAPTILSVEKSGYRPFSLTIDGVGKEPLILGIEKSVPRDIVIDSDMIHLGDNSYSVNSANADDFTQQSSGAFYTKDFIGPSLQSNQKIYLTIGSVIGIDTKQAIILGQSKVMTSYASPPEVYCNGNKICEISINGDKQEIIIPKGIIRQGGKNSITIKAGKNLVQTAYIDYDDIEFMHLMIDVR